MKAVQLYGKGDIRFAEVAPPRSPGIGEVRLRVDAAGICGSDIHNFRTGQWISRSPSIPGHEFSGTIIETGPDTDQFARGDRVVADSRYWCGECATCRDGNQHLCEKLGFVGEICDGGFAEEVTLPARLLLKVDPSVPAEVAATAEPLAVALHAVGRLSPEAGETVLVTGCGMIGALAALLLSRQANVTVRVADRNLARARLVSDVTGADVVEVSPEGLAGVDGVIEATGSTAVLRSLIDTMSGGGLIALVGIFHGKLELDPTVLVERELSLIGCHAFRDELPEAVASLRDLGDAIARLISPPIRLEYVPAAYEAIIGGKVDIPKTVIRP